MRKYLREAYMKLDISDVQRRRHRDAAALRQPVGHAGGERHDATLRASRTPAGAKPASPGTIVRRRHATVPRHDRGHRHDAAVVQRRSDGLRPGAACRGPDHDRDRAEEPGGYAALQRVRLARSGRAAGAGDSATNPGGARPRVGVAPPPTPTRFWLEFVVPRPRLSATVSTSAQKQPGLSTPLNPSSVASSPKTP